MQGWARKEHSPNALCRAKAHLDIAVRPDGMQWSVVNDEEGFGTLVSQLQELGPALVVLEATGGLELAVTAALAAAELPVVVVNPRQVREFARATGRLAKTDRLDAQVIAHFGEAIKPMLRPLPDPETQALAEQLTRRRQVVAMLTAEKNRLHTARPPVRQEISKHIAWLQKSLLFGHRPSTQWREQDNLLQSVPGVGPVVSLTHPYRWQISLVGVAPLTETAEPSVATAP